MEAQFSQRPFVPGMKHLSGMHLTAPQMGKHLHCLCGHRVVHRRDAQGGEGSATYVLDKSRLSIRLVPPYSEGRLAAAREYAKEHGFQVIQTEEKIA